MQSQQAPADARGIIDGEPRAPTVWRFFRRMGTPAAACRLSVSLDEVHAVCVEHKPGHVLADLPQPACPPEALLGYVQLPGQHSERCALQEAVKCRKIHRMHDAGPTDPQRWPVKLRFKSLAVRPRVAAAALAGLLAEMTGHIPLEVAMIDALETARIVCKALGGVITIRQRVPPPI